MNDKIFTNEEIVKALECCVSDDFWCNGCPLNGRCCGMTLEREALALINRLRIDVESLRVDNEQLTINMNVYGLTAKKLAEENESLEIELENMRRNLADAREGWNDAECEVERLRKSLDEYKRNNVK